MLLIADSLPKKVQGHILELGSGPGFLKKYISNLITSEVHFLPSVDLIADGQSLPFKKNSLEAIVMTDVFHHIPSVEAFLQCAAFCVKPGGVIVMIEPWVTWWSKIIYKHLHHEPFDPNADTWRLASGKPLSGANSALPWIVFRRDRKKFETIYPYWKIASVKLHTPFCYLISGGFTIQTHVPVSSFALWEQIEAMFAPYIHSWAMFATIVLVHNGTSYSTFFTPVS